MRVNVKYKSLPVEYESVSEVA